MGLHLTHLLHPRALHRHHVSSCMLRCGRREQPSHFPEGNYRPEEALGQNGKKKRKTEKKLPVSLADPAEMDEENSAKFGIEQ